MKLIFSLLFFIGFGLSLKAQDILIPYRQGNVWGFSNIKGIIIVQPIYDSVQSNQNIPSGYYLVQKHGHWGVITDKKTIIPPTLIQPKFYERGFIMDEVRPRIGNNGALYVVYNMNGEKLMPDPLKQVKLITQKQNPALIIFTHSDNRKSLVSYDFKSQQIKAWILENAVEIDWMYAPLIPKKPNIQKRPKPNPRFMVVIEDDDEPEVEFEEDTRLFLRTFQNQAQLYVEMVFDSVAKNYSTRILSSSDYRNLSKNRDYDRYYGDDRIMDIAMADGGSNARNLTYQIKANACYEIETSGESWNKREMSRKLVEVPFKGFDTIGYLFPEDVSNCYVKMRLENRISSFLPMNYIRYMDQDKFGVITQSGILPALYDTIWGVAPYDRKLPRFVVGQRQVNTNEMLYGIIESDGNILFPIEYQRIEFDKNARFDILSRVLVTKNNRQSLVYRNMSPVLKNTYDEIKPIGSWYTFTLRNGDKFGFHSSDAHIEPIFKYRVYGAETFTLNTKSIKVWKAISEGGKFLGYVNENGVLYFKD